MPFVPPPWQPPTPFGQNACTSDQIASFINECVDADNCATTFAGDPSNQACLQCIETDQSSGLYGPLVTNNGTIVLYNFGGCIDNTEDAGTCGQALNAFNACDEAECGKCPDFDAPSAMGQTAMCEANEFLMGNCTPYNNEGCFSEIEDAGAPAVCNEVSTLLTVWCGPPEVDGGLVDSGPPMDSSPPVDSGTPPVDSGTPPIDTGTPPIDSGSGPSDSGSEAGDGASGG
jgi:hypothetical protein